MRLLYSAQTEADLLARDVLGQETTVTLTRGTPADWTGETGRIDAAMLARRAFPAAERPRVYVCGNTLFAESVAAALVDLGHDPATIRIERYGTSGGQP